MRDGKGFIWISENCSPSPCYIQAHYHSLVAPVMVLGSESLIPNKYMIRVNCTWVNRTLIWNLANTSASWGCYSFTYMEMPRWGLASLSHFPGSFWEGGAATELLSMPVWGTPSHACMTSKLWPFLFLPADFFWVFCPLPGSGLEPDSNLQPVLLGS